MDWQILRLQVGKVLQASKVAHQKVVWGISMSLNSSVGCTSLGSCSEGKSLPVAAHWDRSCILLKFCEHESPTVSLKMCYQSRLPLALLAFTCSTGGLVNV